MNWHIGRRLLLMVILITLAEQGFLPVDAAAQERPSAIKHPVLVRQAEPSERRNVGRAEGRAEEGLARIMAMSEEEIVKLIPMKTGVTFCGCPNCKGGQQESGQFNWSIDRPFTLKCRFCGHEYPSEKYPANRTDKGTNMLGEPVEYHYYFDEPSRRDFWFEACADYHRKSWFVRQCTALAGSYHATGKPEHARHAALILDRFAQAYPHMAVLKQWPFRPRGIVSPTPPFPDGGGKWGRWRPDEVPSGLPAAYDLIYDSPELDKLSKELGVDIRRRIENDFFRATIEYMFTFGKEPTGAHFFNMSPQYTREIINIGRIIGEPAYVHWGYRWLTGILHEEFYYDGMWHEAPSYHYGVVSGTRRVMETLRGYSDPPGYVNPVDGLHFENFDTPTHVPFLEKATRAPEVIAYPNGRISPVHDSWANRPSGSPRERTASTLLAGFGHASLGCGAGADQLQAQLHFSGSYGHEHADNLNLALFAKGSELLSDVGYSHGKLRQWTISTIGHNTVAVDRRNQAIKDSKDSDGDLLMFIPEANGLSAVEARGEKAYRGLAEVYRRGLLLVRVSESDAYVVDVFRVKGGTVHDWLLHGSADEDMTAECSLPLVPREGTLLEPGEKWEEPIQELSLFVHYGLIRNVRRGESRDGLTTTFRYAASSGPTAGAGVRTHLPGLTDAEVFLANSPRVRQAEGDDRKVYDYWMPQLVVRRRGESPLSSVFAAVHEPFRPQPFLTAVRSLPLDPPGQGAVALEVGHGDLLDTIICTGDEPPYPERRLPGGITVRGRLAVLRQRANQVVAAWLIDGLSLKKGEFTLTSPAARYEGTIESATRKAEGGAENALITAAALPEGDRLAGQWMIITHANGHTRGYQISRVERQSDKSVMILTDDHGLQISGQQTEEYYFPRRKMSGPNRFVIHASATFRAPQ
jgi:hypothetical protein